MLCILCTATKGRHPSRPVICTTEGLGRQARNGYVTRGSCTETTSPVNDSLNMSILILGRSSTLFNLSELSSGKTLPDRAWAKWAPTAGYRLDLFCGPHVEHSFTCTRAM